MAETAITAVLSKFGELAASEAKILLEVGDKMTLLRDRLEWLQAFIRDADRRRRAGTDQLTRVWVRQTRDVAFEAEDTLDDFIYQVDLKSQGYRCWKKMWYKYLIGCCNQIASRHSLSAKISRINTRLAKIAENQKEYNIGHTPLAPVTSSTTASSAWSNDAVGFDDDVKKLKQMLFSKDHTRQMFISILGESGVGKETLVKTLINNNQEMEETITSVFKILIWYNVAPDSTVDFLFQEIYNRAVDWCKRLKIAEPKQADGIVDFTDKLRLLLTEKRYLVILGGISSKTMLNCVKASLPDDNNGSRVMLVLNIEREEVAWHANSMNQEGFNGIHMLSRLDEKRSGLLFHSRAFRIKREEVEFDDGSKEDRERYDKIVYDITGGYPLAIVVLSGLLRFKERPGQWEAVLQQLRPIPEVGLVVQSGDGEGSNNQLSSVTLANHRLQPSTAAAATTTTTTIERVFWASFEDLPNDLKSCFLYFAAFPKNTDCVAGDIVKMWMAEGFIKPQKGKTIEELGHDYLMELALRCLVQIASTDEAGGIDSVSIHPRLHGFLHSEAREAGFMEVHDMHHVFVPPSVRRLSFTTLGGRYTPFTNKFPKLRSFICWVVEEQHISPSTDDIQDDTDKNKKLWYDLKFLCGSKFLRVLCIYKLKIEVLPNCIGDMINLRFLHVDCKDLKKLPSSIKRLLNLQTLDISNTQVEEIDPGFWKIKTLRHVLAEKLMLPETIEEELAELQTLFGVKPAAQGGEWKEQNCPLHKMPNVRALKLHGITHEKHGVALRSALVKMHHLRYLNLQGDDIPSCVFTARSLRFLLVVELDGTIKEWPEIGWDGSKVRPNLIWITLTNNNCYLPQHIREEFDKILHIPKAGLRREISTNAAQGEVEEILVED